MRELQRARAVPAGAVTDPATGVVSANGKPVGVDMGGGDVVAGFPDAVAPARALLAHDAGLGLARAGAARLHPQPRPPRELDAARGEMVLLPTFRLPTLIHTRSGNAKYLNEISHRNPLWIHTSDAARLGLATGDLVRVTTEIGYFVNRVWVTEAIAPGRRRLLAPPGPLAPARRRGQPLVGHARVAAAAHGAGTLLRHVEGVGPFASADPDSRRIWWTDGGVHQNLTFPVQPDPVVRHALLAPAGGGRPRADPEDRYGDVFVDTTRSMEVYREWLREVPSRPRPRRACAARCGWTGRCGRPRRCSGPERPSGQSVALAQARRAWASACCGISGATSHRIPTSTVLMA